VVISSSIWFGVTVLLTSNAKRSMEVSYSYEPMAAPGITGGDVAEPTVVEQSRWDRFIDKALDNANTAIWAIVQAFIIGRYVKKRGE